MANSKLYELHHSDPHCHWCGVETITPKAITKRYEIYKLPAKERKKELYPPNMATVDHLYSRLNPVRAYYKRTKRDIPVVLSCAQCNHERGVEEHRHLTKEVQDYIGRISGRPNRKTAMLSILKSLRRKGIINPNGTTDPRHPRR